MSNDFFFFGNEALSDNAYVSGTGFNGVSLVAGGSYDQANGRVNEEWGYRFRAIRKCNIVTTNIDRVPNLDPTLKKRIVAEARFIRAYSYFELVNWFGDVPFYTNLITIDEAKTIARTPKATVLEFILKELSEIRNDLPTNTEYAEKDRGRITRGAAIALTARIRTFTGEWPEVKKECEALMNVTSNGTYGLVANYADLFKTSGEFNNEVILDLQYGGGRTFSTQRSFLPQTVSLLRATLVPTQDLVDDYIMTNGKAIGETGSGYNENTPYVNRDPRMEQTIIRHGSTIVDVEGKHKRSSRNRVLRRLLIAWTTRAPRQPVIISASLQI
ncbi:RagB/SusD family nutrient uptake outer membrane protein [Chitinophaga sedimenti]|uniref:RagB/SusD family nutrient uptake outer membrane protein n=1 Tax=Chitinophaga sedimenti TaxID=2033606 RepID=UPI00249DAD05|nr:RagB/SusD family nutrient uptake outer membrane protein [Chitinophaga sedimenti]